MLTTSGVRQSFAFVFQAIQKGRILIEIRPLLRPGSLLEFASLRLLLLAFDISYGCVELTLKLLNTVIAAMQIGAKANHHTRCRRGLLNRILTQAAEPQLLSMEGRSVRAMHGCCCAKGYESLITSTQHCVTEHP